MPNPYYNENFQGQAGQTARADHVKSQLTAVGSGFDAIDQLFGRQLRVPPGETLLDMPALAARAGRFLRFNAAGNPETVQSGFTWRSDHAGSINYAVGDVVRAGIYGTIYICVVAHLSTGTINLTNFAVMIDLQGLNIIRNVLITASLTVVMGSDYMVNSSGGDVVVTLPAAPSILDAPINITHVAGTLAAGQLITIARNGKLIMGLAEDLSVNTVNASFSLMFANDALGWRLRVLA